jgi:hypothetical protein
LTAAAGPPRGHHGFRRDRAVAWREIPWGRCGSGTHRRPVYPQHAHHQQRRNQRQRTQPALQRDRVSYLFDRSRPGCAKRWDRQIGLSGISKIVETGGEWLLLSTSQPVNFKPYLNRLLKYFDNQYYLVFSATQGKKDSLQRVNIRTATKNSEILAADNVWVPGPPKEKK